MVNNAYLGGENNAQIWIKRNIEYERRAIAMIELTHKERSMKILKRYLARRRQKNKAIDYWEKFERRNLLEHGEQT